MNIPIAIYTVFIVVDGKIINIGNLDKLFSGLPSKEEVEALALQKGYKKFTDYTTILIDDGRQF